jgi:hypothetical protein
MSASFEQHPNASMQSASSRRIQINTSPNAGEVDFSPLGDHCNNLGQDFSSLDLVSVADLLRNGFVYPPHSIYKDVKIAATGFDPQQDMHEHPNFHFAFQAALACSRPTADAIDDDELLETFHRLLCDAVARATAGIRSPWLLQSGGKDSTTMAIVMSEVRPETMCLTYLGGHEENEVASAQFVARKLGLRHEALICDPGRAYDRYLAMVPRTPLLTADFAALSYADLATEIHENGGDGIIDALGSDQYFGVPLHNQERVLAILARGLHVPQSVFKSRLVSRSFKLCFALATLQMQEFERYFPGSRFSDTEVDELFGKQVAAQSRKRVETFHTDISTAASAEAVRRISLVVGESAHLAKGMYAAKAMSLRLAYPFCDPTLRDWIFNEVPDDRLIGPGGVNKVLMRNYIAQHFDQLPYVKSKGCFRFNLLGLARQRFDQVHAFSMQTRALLPGAPHWLETHRSRLDNKYFASKFYLLAMTLPWLISRMQPAPNSAGAIPDASAVP